MRQIEYLGQLGEYAQLRNCAKEEQIVAPLHSLACLFTTQVMFHFQERLRLLMVQEWCRAEQNVELSSKEKGPISAISILYYQKDDKYRKLVTCLIFTYLFIRMLVEGYLSY